MLEEGTRAGLLIVYIINMGRRDGIVGKLEEI